MHDLSTHFTQILQIIWIDLVLSGDNAVVIGLACRGLPQQQRAAGVAVGTGAAILARVLLTLIAVEILQAPYVRLIGGLLLLWIAIKLVLAERRDKDVSPAKSIFAAIRIIVVADTVMSLDNVMAIAAAAKGSFAFVAFGLALSVPFVVFGASLLTALFERYPLLIWAGTILIGYIGGELISAEPSLAAWPVTHVRYWPPACGIASALLVVALSLLLLGGRRREI